VTDDSSRVKEINDILQNIKSDEVGYNEISVVFGQQPVFIDCGSNLECISCPNCNQELPSKWWGQAMNNSYASHFGDLTVTTPCCNTITSLNNLEYDMPCGFASFYISIANPKAEPTQNDLERIESVLGVPVKTVIAHY
jgi:hypothetical protein